MTRIKVSVWRNASPSGTSHELVDDPADRRGETHDEGNGKTHTDGGVYLIGAAEEGAAAEELREDKVVYQDRTKGD